jgi:hypothetical protein
MVHPARRLADRRRLRRPIEAVLTLCRGDRASGWIVDEQADGLGMAFGADDVPLLGQHADCCIGNPADLRLEGYADEERPIPVRLAHVTRHAENLVCRAGLSFDVSRMRSEDVARLLRVWRTLLAPSS